MTFPPTSVDDAVEMATIGVLGCAYNAAVNHGSERGACKMGDLIRALNREARLVGRQRLERLVAWGIIKEFKPCPPQCLIRPGGLFHADGCENDFNHPVYRARERAAQAELPGKLWKGGAATYVALVGDGEGN